MRENLLRAKIVEHEMDIQTFCEKIGVDRTTFYRWLKDPGAIPLRMLWSIKNVLELTDTELISIFFSA